MGFKKFQKRKSEHIFFSRVLFEHTFAYNNHEVIIMWNQNESKITEDSNKRWEGMRMMLPEHVQALRQRKFERTKIEKPVLDEQEWEIINEQLSFAVHNEETITIEYFKDGFIEEITGIIIFHDNQLKRIKLHVNEWDHD